MWRGVYVCLNGLGALLRGVEVWGKDVDGVAFWTGKDVSLLRGVEGWEERDGSECVEGMVVFVEDVLS